MPKEYIIPNKGCWFQVKGTFQLPSGEWIAAGAKGWCYDTDPVENTITLVIGDRTRRLGARRVRSVQPVRDAGSRSSCLAECATTEFGY